MQKDSPLKFSNMRWLVGTLCVASGLLFHTRLSLAQNDQVDVKAFGAVGDGATDDQAAIMRAAQALESKGGGRLYFPPGIYMHSDILLLGSGITVHGSPKGDSILKATNPARETLQFLDAKGCGVSDLKFQGAPSRRLQAYISTDIFLERDTDCTIQRVIIDGAAAAGMVVDNSRDIRVLNNDVQNTMADGIHVTGSSQNVLVADNKAQHTGDDSFAAVAYGKDPQTSDVIFRNNTSTDSKSRGVTCIGPRGCVIENNTIVNPEGHGIAVAYEGSYKTHHPSNAIVRNNTIENVGHGGMNAILVDSADEITLESNHLSGSKPILITASKGVIVSGNDVKDALGIGIHVLNSQDVHIVNNHLEAAAGPAISLDMINASEVKGNRIENGKSVIADVEISRSSGVSGDGNISMHSAAPSAHVLRIQDSDVQVKVLAQ